MKLLTKIILSILLVISVAVWAAVVEAPDHHFKLAVLNVGQGDSTLIKTPSDKYLLIDGGPDNSVLDELGREMPFYQKQIEAVFLTHPHADHVFGLIEVLKRYQVKHVYMTGIVHTTNEYLEFLNTIKDKKIPTSNLKAGDALSFDGVNIKIFWPKDDVSIQTVDNLNNTSLVMSVAYQNFKALMMGDLEKDAQDQMMASADLGTNYDVIKFAHHGSSNGMNEKLIDLVEPKTAVISVGANNMYGHPAASTIEKLQSRGITIKRTDRDGRVEFSE